MADPPLARPLEPFPPDPTGRPNTLVILGVSVRAAAQSAQRAGWQPYGIDCFADRDLAACGPAIRITHYPVEFLRALIQAPHAPWIYTGGLENYPRLVDRLAAVRPLWGNPGRVLAQVRAMGFLAQAARAAGLPFPETRRSPPQEGGKPGCQWLVKPRRSGGGVGIRWLEDFSAVRSEPLLPRGCHLQRYVHGTPAGAVFLFAKEHATLLGVTRQLVGRDLGRPAPFQYAGSIGPVIPTAEEEAALNRLAQVLAEKVPLRGLVNLDYLRQSGPIVPLEINPRYSASVEVLEQASGAALLSWHISACGGPPAPSAPRRIVARAAAGKVVVYAPCCVAAEDLELASRQARLSDQGIALADLPSAPERVPPGQPLCTLLAEGEDPQELQPRLKRAAQQLERCLVLRACRRPFHPG